MKGAPKSCKHCGKRFRARSPEAEFCCDGCASVHGLIQSEGLSHFYDLQSGPGQPVGERVGGVSRFDWADSAQEEAERSGHSVIDLEVSGMTCRGCVWLIERVLSKEPGVDTIGVSLYEGRLSLNWRPGGFKLASAAEALEQFGYSVRLWAPSRFKLSWQAIRALTLALFCLNLLGLGAVARIGGEPSVLRLVDLLSSVFCGLGLYLAFADPLQASVRGVLSRCWHSDMVTLPALFLSSIVIGFKVPVEARVPDFAFLLTLLGLVFFIGRWVEALALSGWVPASMLRGTDDDSKQGWASWFAVGVGLVLMVPAFLNPLPLEGLFGRLAGLLWLIHGALLFSRRELEGPASMRMFLDLLALTGAIGVIFWELGIGFALSWSILGSWLVLALAGLRGDSSPRAHA